MRSHALFVGINRYPGFGPEAQLEGAVNDVYAVAELLARRWSMPAEQRIYRLDEGATRAAILDGLEALRRRVGRNDRVLFYFSGHGSQITDREGDEGDGLDETIVPVDSGRRPWPNRDITDDEIHAWAARVLEKTPHLVMIFDSCHAATLHRPRWRVRSVPADRRPVGELPPSPLVSAGRLSAGAATRDIDPPDSPIQLAACGDQELAYEMPARVEGEARGVFSHHLVEVLRRAPAEESWRELFARVRSAVHRRCRGQRPTISGAAVDRPWNAGPSWNAGLPGRRAVDTAGAGTRLLHLARDRDGWRFELFRSRRGPWQASSLFQAGDRLRVDLSHDERCEHFVYLLDIGATGRASLVFPEPHGHEALDPGPTLSVGDRRDGELELFWPPGVPANLREADCHLVLVANPSPLSAPSLASADLPADAIVLARTYRLVR